MTSIIDTHAHIDLPEFDADRQDMIGRMLAAGVHAVVAIGYSPERWRSTAQLAEQYPFVVRTVGLHPNSAAEWSPSVLAGLERELGTGNAIVGVGEIGLDYFREHAARETQLEAFDAQLQLARRYELPIVIHQRNAEADVIDILSRHAPLDGIMHCFSGDRSFATHCLNLGLHLGVGGVATYPKSTEVREALGFAPLDRLVIETDAPFLAPQGYRGKRNEPGWVVVALETVAALHRVDREEAAAVTTQNAERLFGDALTRARSAGAERAACA
jgi:TatD DNase family protein